MSVRKRSELEAPEHLFWLTKQSAVDWETLNYPTVEKYVSEDENGTRAYLHHHAALVIESAAFKPDSDAKTRLESAIELVQNCIERARANGLREIYFQSSDERTDEAMQKWLKFEPVKMLKLRV